MASSHANVEADSSKAAVELVERNRELDALRNLAVDAMRFENEGPLLASMLDTCRQAVGANGGAIYLYDLAVKRLVLMAHHGMRKAFVESTSVMKLGQGFTGKVAVSKSPALIEDLANHPLLEFPAAKDQRIYNFASFPLTVNEKLLGVMNLFTEGAATFTARDFNLLHALSTQVSLSLDHIKRVEELRERNAELERFNRLAVDRELRMIELKKRIRDLETQLKLSAGKPEPEAEPR